MVGDYIPKMKTTFFTEVLIVNKLFPNYKLQVIKETHRFSLLINSLINCSDRVDFEVSQRLGLRFYRSNTLMLFCSPLHVYSIGF